LKIKFCGAAKTVTGSCFYVDTGKVKFLVDCGAFQGPDELEALNRKPLPFPVSELNYVFLTHSHYDHCGRLPLLVKQGFHGKIIATQPTRDLTQLILLDSAKIQKEDYERNKAKPKYTASQKKKQNFAGEGDVYSIQKPLYTEEDVVQTMSYFDLHAMSDSRQLEKGLEFRMRDAGHILGSTIMEFWLENGGGKKMKLVFSGDLGQPGQRIVKDPDMLREADYVIVESTYGDRLHRSKDDTVLELLGIIKQTLAENGNVIIPVFAIERAQEMIYELNLFYENKILSSVPVYLDSPMAQEATEIFKRYPVYFDEDAIRLLEKGDDPFTFEDLKYVRGVEESKRLADKRGVIIMAGSGMATGGRVVHHIMQNISNERNRIVFVGFQVKGTLGRRLVDGESPVRIRGREFDVRAKVHLLEGFSAHADERDLRYWLRGFGRSPKKIFVVHGEESVANAFANNIREELMVETLVPSMEEEFELE